MGPRGTAMREWQGKGGNRIFCEGEAIFCTAVFFFFFHFFHFFQLFHF